MSTHAVCSVLLFHFLAFGIEELMAVCGRFGVGLMTIHPYYKSFKYDIQLDAVKHHPNEEYLEEYLGYIFEKYPHERTRFDELFRDQTQ